MEPGLIPSFFRKLALAWIAAGFLISHSASAVVEPGASRLSTRFESADMSYKSRRDERLARNALDSYRKILEKDGSDAEAGWRLAMACYFVGLRLTVDTEERAKLFAEGRTAGQAALKTNPSCAPCHFWTAINMALYGQEIGVLKMLFSLKQIREHLNTSIQIDPKYASAGAYRLLGAIDQKLPGIFGGDNGRAKEYFEKAIALAPDEPLNYLFLARLQEENLDDLTGAIRTAELGVEIRDLPQERLESLEARDDLKRWLSEKKTSKDLPNKVNL